MTARLTLGVFVLLGLLLALAVSAPACGPKRVRLTIGELRDLEACVLDAEDQVARQNCVERFIPTEDR